MDHAATSEPSQPTRRRRLYFVLDPSAWPSIGLSPLNQVIVILILCSVAIAIVESEPAIYEGREGLFSWAEMCLAATFLVEYMLRLWVSVESPSYRGGFKGRLRYAFSPMALLDLMAVLPLFFVLAGSEAFLFRLFRLIRIMRLSKIGRYSLAISAIRAAIHSRRYELIMSLCIAGLLLLISSTLLYIVEGDTQPAAFGSIPRAMWWSVATLTTVGYGDVVPVTVLGRILAGITAIIGIGLIAMPTGILAAAFSSAIENRRITGTKENEDDD